MQFIGFQLLSDPVKRKRTRHKQINKTLFTATCANNDQPENSPRNKLSFVLTSLHNGTVSGVVRQERKEKLFMFDEVVFKVFNTIFVT